MALPKLVMIRGIINLFLSLSYKVKSQVSDKEGEIILETVQILKKIPMATF